MKFPRNEIMKLQAMLVGALMLASTTYGQTTNDTALTKSPSEFTADKQESKFVFELPETIDAQKVDEAMVDYKDYFIANFNGENNRLEIQLKTGSNQEKFYVHRMLTALNVLYVKQDGAVVSIREFSLKNIEN